MRSAKLNFSALFVGAFMVLALFQSCKENDCKDAICAPCPSSRLVFAYQDSTGACVPGFHSGAMVYAIAADNPTDTAYTYSFSDSCQVGFLINEDMIYHVRSGNVHDVISFYQFDYQDPLNVTECCLCYPVKTVNAQVNGDSVNIEFPAGLYENTPYVRVIN